MEYTLGVATEACGDVLPLHEVANAMARHAASGFGKLPFHKPTYKTTHTQYTTLLLDAAVSGLMTVCDYDGRIATAKEIIASCDELVTQKNCDIDMLNIIPLNVKIQHLIEWGKVNGDTFHIVDMPAERCDLDLRDDEFNVIEPGYYRGFVGPWVTLVSPSDIAPESSNKKVYRLREQEKQILAWLTTHDYNPERLPKRSNGHGTVKALAKNDLNNSDMFKGTTTFDKAWDRLRTNKEIKEGDK